MLPKKFCSDAAKMEIHTKIAWKLTPPSYVSVRHKPTQHPAIARKGDTLSLLKSCCPFTFFKILLFTKLGISDKFISCLSASTIRNHGFLKLIFFLMKSFCRFTLLKKLLFKKVNFLGQPFPSLAVNPPKKSGLSKIWHLLLAQPYYAQCRTET